ncbi:hypothetical protein I203_107480 [Kwoniella mangroviensis CBS 8507]|uniref:hypothetical protein n=1 Tax=Kwoniella mangroviensis CBS 8507 TaxID=1296122 RepID=UPI00080D25A1|nr:uncharacterized protein I203_02233 [Kwoniella mangroviensis CBS 8507]OCF68842.1 hypothetical protein I203_02233 [Kwoniella mangroviensis CBS 8507]
MSTAQQTPILNHSYQNASELLSEFMRSPLPLLPDKKTHTFPSTRSPDVHTKAVAFALCPHGWWPASKNQKRRIFAPCITIKDDKTGAFQPKEPLPFKARVPISETSHPLLYFATKKWLCLMSEDNGKTYGRALGEAAQQGFLFVEEGLILSQLFALDEHGSSIFFDELPPSAKGGG